MGEINTLFFRVGRRLQDENLQLWHNNYYLCIFFIHQTGSSVSLCAIILTSPFKHTFLLVLPTTAGCNLQSLTSTVPVSCSCLMHRHTHVCRFGILLRSGASTEEPLSHPENAVVQFACVISPNTMTGFTEIEAYFGLEMLFLIWFTSFKTVTSPYPPFCAVCFVCFTEVMLKHFREASNHLSAPEAHGSSLFIDKQLFLNCGGKKMSLVFEVKVVRSVDKGSAHSSFWFSR